MPAFGGGPLPSSGVLDGPPPAPNPGAGGPSAGGLPPTLSGLAAPLPMTSGDLPPEVLTGITAAAQKILGMFDSFAQVTPDLALDWDLCKTVLNKALGKLMVAGSGPVTPTAPGPQFPGGGIDKGIAQQGPL